MKFEQALEQMRLGNSIRRSSWRERWTISITEEGIIESWKRDLRRAVWDFGVVSILAEDWEVVEPPRTLEEVLPAFREGKKIRRRSWKKDMLIAPYQYAGTYVAITVGDMKANDWEILND